MSRPYHRFVFDMSASDTALIGTPRSGWAATRVHAARLARRIDLPIVAIVAIAFLWIDHYTARVTHWGVMTDELQYVRLALSIGDDHTLVPHIHGQYVHIYGQLYPLVLAPIYQLFDAATAFKVAHVVNALLMASTAVPAYLLAREVTGRRGLSYAVGALTVAVPWMVLSTLILTEVIAYPVFVWTVWAIYRAVVEPSTRRDVVAVVWLVVAFFGRTQFVVLWAIPPVVVLVHELGYRGAGETRGMRARLAGVLRMHRVLVVVYALAVLALIVANLRGGVSQLLGNYAVTTTGALFPNGMLEFMRTHAAWVGVGIGIAPVLLALAWAVPTLFRPLDRREHAFAVLLLATGVLITVQVASFTLRFTIGPSIEDRYEFFMVPLVLVGALACLLDRRPRTVALLVTGAVAAYLIGITKFEPTLLPYFASPDAVFHKVLTGRAWQLGHHLGFSNLTAAAALRWATVALALGLAAALRWAPRRPVMAVVGAGVLAWGAVQGTYVFRQITPEPPTDQTSLTANVTNKQWADHLLPAGAQAAILPAAQYNRDAGAEGWWDIEMWNKKVTRAISFRGDPLATPFPASPLAIQFSSGRLIGPEAKPWLIFDSADVRMRPEGVVPEQLVQWGKNASELVRPRTPWRADWATVGFDTDGWGEAGHHTRSVRVYRYGGAKGRIVGLTMTTQAPPGAARRYVVSAQGRRWKGELAPNEVTTIQVPVCVRAGQPFVDVDVSTAAPFALPDKRNVTLHLDRVNARPAPQVCKRPAGRR